MYNNDQHHKMFICKKGLAIPKSFVEHITSHEKKIETPTLLVMCKFTLQYVKSSESSLHQFGLATIEVWCQTVLTTLQDYTLLCYY